MLLGLRSMLPLLIILSTFTNYNAQKHPNVILILTDDQGWGDLSINGNRNLETPNIDQLAKEGITFSKFFVQPVCSPTRSEILTGRYHPRSGVYSTSQGGERMDLDEITIADILKSQGYKTAAFGKWHNGMQPPYHPNARGFDEFYGFASGHWGNYYSPMLERNGEIVKGDGYLPDDLTTEAIGFIKKNRRKPFFLYLPYNTPHSPMQVPERYWEKQKNSSLSMRNRNAIQEDTMFTKAALAMVENIDYNVGRLTEALEKMKLEEETIIIYLSDNGPNGVRWNGGMKGRKGSTDEGGVKSPLIIKWKNQLPAGEVRNELSGAVDLLPTILSLAGLEFEVKNTLDGYNMLDDKFSDKVRYIYNYWRGNLSIRSDSFRLDKSDALFHMEDDPGQYEDVRYKYEKEYKILLEAKSEWMKEIGSQLPQIDERPFPVGHADYGFTQLPARDAEFSDGIVRSNRWPNSSHLKNWNTTRDSIYWEVDVLTAGTYEAEIYYTCPDETVGTEIQLSAKNADIQTQISEAYDPPEIGAINDVYPRMEGPEKYFKSLILGQIELEEGRQNLTLRLPKVAGDKGLDFRLMMLNRKED